MCYSSPFFPSPFSVWCVPRELFDHLQQWNEGYLRSGQGFNQGTKKSWWVTDDGGQAWQPASLAKWSRRSNSCSPQTGIKLTQSRMSKKCGCCSCTVLTSRPWAKDLTLLRCRPSLRLLMLMALEWSVCPHVSPEAGAFKCPTLCL